MARVRLLSVSVSVGDVVAEHAYGVAPEPCDITPAMHGPVQAERSWVG